MKTPALVLVAAFGLAGCATATPYDTFAAYDMDGDLCLDRQEVIEARLAERSWTVAPDGTITERAFVDDLGSLSVFEAYDANNDGFVDAMELGARGTTLGAYAPWDVDRDNRVTRTELYEGLYSAWDADRDGMVDPDEANMAYYAMWDVNSDRCWDVNEYNASLVIDPVM